MDLGGKALSVKRDRSTTFWDSRPRPSFPSISITGQKCALNCAHCRSKYLKNMIPAESPERLYEVCIELESEEGHGVLISGGYNEEGYVPFEGFVETISRINAETDLFITVHSGLIPENLARNLGDAGVDMVDFDFTLDEEAIYSIFGLKRGGKDYEGSLNFVEEYIPYISPHILLGLSGGSLEMERKALETLTNYDICSLVLLIIIIPEDDPMNAYEVPSGEEIYEFIRKARLTFPEIPLSLGCMRPRDKERINAEVRAVKAGIDRIVMPHEKAIRAALEENLEIRRMGACCAVPEKEVERWYGV